MAGKRALSGLSCGELIEILKPLPRYRSIQIFKWIACGVQNFAEMSNLPMSLREQLAGQFIIRSCKTDSRADGADGTIKLLIALEDGNKIESVLLTDNKNRKTACLSTQAGCSMGCVFCKTGSLGFVRNLCSAEIVEQYLLLLEAGGSVSNIVIMGMGEPLLNLTELRKALEVFGDKQGLKISMRRITVSTCGISEGIIDLADKGPGVRLAFSLTTADENLRKRLMPICGTQSLEKIKKALVYFQKSGGGRITLEAVLFAGINTRLYDASRMADFAAGLDVVVNLIPWNSFDNPSPCSSCEPERSKEFGGKFRDAPALREPKHSEVTEFKRRLEAMGLKVTCRFGKGRSVSGACGQLGVVNEAAR